MSSQRGRMNRYRVYQNYFDLGSDQASSAAIYNKTFAYIDDLESLCYSPVSLKFNISDPDLPNLIQEAKGRAAATRLRNLARKVEVDTMISPCVREGLIKGKGLMKLQWKRGTYHPTFIRPENFGVRNEAHTKLDEDMGAFCYSYVITLDQFANIVWKHPDKEALLKKARRYMKEGKPGMATADEGNRTLTVASLYPFQQAGGGANNSNAKPNMVDWMTVGAPQVAPDLYMQMMQVDELWVWSDQDEDWATFQIIGDDILIMGKYQRVNAFSWNYGASEPDEHLKGHHPFRDFTPNPVEGYYWGCSEIPKVALLQECINTRLLGLNDKLRMLDDPPKKFIGSTGVNQQAVARFNKPGGYWSDTNPNAKVDSETIEVPTAMWEAIAEYERMFDEMGGLPPIAKGRGEAGVRSQGHAETLVRMFSPRFKDKALLVERDVESVGALMLDINRAHDKKKMFAWVPEESAGSEAAKPDPLIMPPAPGLARIDFAMADLTEEMVVTVDSHSASPAFLAEAKALIFDLFKIGAADAAQVVEHTDAPDPDQLVAGIKRRDAAKAAELQRIAQQDPKAAERAVQGGKRH